MQNEVRHEKVSREIHLFADHFDQFLNLVEKLAHTYNTICLLLVKAGACNIFEKDLKNIIIIIIIYGSFVDF